MNPFIIKIKNKFRKDSFFYQLCKAIYMLPGLLFSWYGYPNQYFLFPLKAFLRKHHIKPFYDHNTRNLEQLRNIHSGKRCFIIATGPSLRIEDMECLNDEVTIGMNFLYKAFEKTKFRPTYYIVLDINVQKSVDGDLSKDEYAPFCKSNLFFNKNMKSAKSDITYIPVCYKNHWFSVSNPRFKPSKNLVYNTDLVWGLYDKYTVTAAAIDLAIYMGCKEIYLIGVDCNYSGSQKHFYASDNIDKKLDNDYLTLSRKAMMAGYKFIDKETRKRGIRVYNATRGGMLEEFERVDFDSLLPVRK